MGATRLPPPPRQRFTYVAALASFVGVNPRTVREAIRRGVLRAVRLPLHYTDDRPRAHGKSRARWVVYEDDAQAYLDKFRTGLRLPRGVFRKQ